MEKHPYADILNMERPRSQYAKMPAIMRAAQFAPFAALTGYEDSIQEAARLVDERPQLDEQEAERLNQKLIELMERDTEPAKLRVFVPDPHKAGGAIVLKEAFIEKWDEFSGELKLGNGEKIRICDIIDAE